MLNLLLVQIPASSNFAFHSNIIYMAGAQFFVQFPVGLTYLSE